MVVTKDVLGRFQEKRSYQALMGHPNFGGKEGAMFEKASNWSRRGFVSLLSFGILTMMLLGAVQTARGQSYTKGVYVLGYQHYFGAEKNGNNIYHVKGTVIAGQFQGKVNNTIGVRVAITSEHIGLCVFANLIYLFYENYGYPTQGIRYLVYDPVNDSVLEEHVLWYDVPAGATNSGCAAAVLNGAIHVFHSGGTFTSRDGRNWACKLPWGLSWSPGIFDAVTFYPPGTAPASIMIVYIDPFGGKLSSKVFDGDKFTNQQKLTDTEGFLNGNLLLGTSLEGAKSQCIQLYSLGRFSDRGWGAVQRWEYNLSNTSWTLSGNMQTIVSAVPSFAAAPWFGTVDTKGTMQMYHTLYYFSPTGNAYETYLFRSDFMVPKNYDSQWGWKGAPTPTQGATGSDDMSKILRQYWTLIGVVLGPPPFVLNGETYKRSIDEYSSVEYSSSQSQSVTQTNESDSSLMISSETEAKTELGPVGAKFTIDAAYGHGLTSKIGDTSTVTVHTGYTFGPVDEQDVASVGTHGWAVFNAPVMIVQCYELYAYDYDFTTGTGTYLNQDVYAISVGDMKTQTAYFELANPSNGSIQDLFSGMGPFPKSTDLKGWLGKNWNDTNNNWEVVVGDKTNPSMGTLNLGVATDQAYTQGTKHIESEGGSNSVSLSAGASFKFDIGLIGIKETLKVSGDFKWTYGTETETAIDKTVRAKLGIPIPTCTPETKDRIKTLTIQPYWLRAKTDSVPWVPPGLKGQRPWALTWNVLQYTTCGGNRGGVSLGPLRTNGRVVGPGTIGGGGIQAASSSGGSSYEVEGGSMVWVDAEGNQEPIPMTADDFNPTIGAKVSINGHEFLTDSSRGSWRRKGNRWIYETDRSVNEDRFELKLDFTTHKWTFEANKAFLHDHIPPCEDDVTLILVVNDKYTFVSHVNHHIDSDWEHENIAVEGTEKMRIATLSGSYKSASDKGYLRLKGRLPENLDHFGDMTISVNGFERSFRISQVKNFIQKLMKGGSITHREKGAYIRVNFKKKTWEARIKEGLFHPSMVPNNGKLRLIIRVGGEVWLDKTMNITDHRTSLVHQHS